MFFSLFLYELLCDLVEISRHHALCDEDHEPPYQRWLNHEKLDRD